MDDLDDVKSPAWSDDDEAGDDEDEELEGDEDEEDGEDEEAPIVPPVE
ncbi:hypothetical protein HY375_02520 [Candidatus Berkelbacteria bacterium]|nr:hypothetical protein [Candidatus Berkelbacteria bacterium]